MVPNNVASKCYPLIIPKHSLEHPNHAPSPTLAVYLDGSIKSGSSLPYSGKPFKPKTPFSP